MILWAVVNAPMVNYENFQFDVTQKSDRLFFQRVLSQLKNWPQNTKITFTISQKWPWNLIFTRGRVKFKCGLKL